MSVTSVTIEFEPLPTVVRVTPWDDPLVDRRGHDPRSAYVEQFWLSVLGPTATWLLRRLVAGFDHHPDGYELDVAGTARALGLSVTKGMASPFAKALQRCIMFGVAQRLSEAWVVRRRVPSISQRHLLRLPPSCSRRTSSGRGPRSASTPSPAPTPSPRRCSPPATTAACSSRSSSPSASRPPAAAEACELLRRQSREPHA